VGDSVFIHGRAAVHKGSNGKASVFPDPQRSGWGLPASFWRWPCRPAVAEGIAPAERQALSKGKPSRMRYWSVMRDREGR